jgi:aryl-alcohol dehydrogenase-like predicted oxidoreductase
MRAFDDLVSSSKVLRIGASDNAGLGDGEGIGTSTAQVALAWWRHRPTPVIPFIRARKRVADRETKRLKRPLICIQQVPCPTGHLQ